jgi:hypothetical protein
MCEHEWRIFAPVELVTFGQGRYLASWCGDGIVAQFASEKHLFSSATQYLTPSAPYRTRYYQ